MFISESQITNSGCTPGGIAVPMRKDASLARRAGMAALLLLLVIGRLFAAALNAAETAPTIGPAAVVEVRHAWEPARTAKKEREVPMWGSLTVDVRSPELWFQSLVDRGLLEDPRDIKDKELIAEKAKRDAAAKDLMTQAKAAEEALVKEKVLPEDPRLKKAKVDQERATVKLHDAALWWREQQEIRWRNQVEDWLGKVCLFFDGKPMRDLVPEWVDPWPWDEYEAGDSGKFARYYSLQFRLRKTEANHEAWLDLLRGWGVSDRPVAVTVGLLKDKTTDRVMAMQTEVSPTGSKPWQRFEIKTSPVGKLAWSVVLIVVVAGLLVWLGVQSDLLRDVTAPPNPSGRYPYSLGRCQMAFWLILVGGGWLFLWVITGEYNTLTESELTLIGISASTGLGAVLIGQVAPPRRAPVLTAEELKERDPVKLQAMREAEEKVVKAREQTLATRRNATAAQRLAVVGGQATQALVDQAAMEEKQAETEMETAQRRVTELHDREQYFKPFGKVQLFVLDLLRERQSVSFHRFQMLAWTLLMGLVFAFGVLLQLAMPKFNSTLLLLLGISSGTYLGFKWPEAKKES